MNHTEIRCDQVTIGDKIGFATYVEGAGAYIPIAPRGTVEKIEEGDLLGAPGIRFVIDGAVLWMRHHEPILRFG